MQIMQIMQKRHKLDNLAKRGSGGRLRGRDPVTADEWQEAVDSAEFLLGLDSCRQYGLLEGGPAVKVERCAYLLKRGKALGYRPAPAEELVRRFCK